MSLSPLRVLVVDDSPLHRKLLVDILASSRDFEIVGKAADGEQALRLATTLRPDAITLDLEMPKMDGFTFLRILMSRQPTPVVVVSSFAHKENVFKALELGAIDFIARPDAQAAPDGPLRREVLQKMQLIRSLRPAAPTGSIPPPSSRPATSQRAVVPDTGRVHVPEALAGRTQGSLRYVVAIASSTGGPSALLELFARVPERFPGAILVAQHMPDKFTRTFAERLDKKGPLGVAEAQDGEIVAPRRGYVCPGKMCMELVPAAGGVDLRLRVTPPAKDDRYAPSADRLFRSVAQSAGSRAIAVVLTGMGDDGTAGARAIRAAGGTVIAESEQTAVVYGMPRAVAVAGLAHESLALPAIGELLSLLA
jgi:two-component system chemotaxis response regulator CheB